MNRREAKLISELLVSVIAKSMGYNFPQDRIERIAESSRELRKEGCASLLSVAAAFELDLLLYGNPLREVPHHRNTEHNSQGGLWRANQSQRTKSLIVAAK